MKKQINGETILYRIAWSKFYKYDKYSIRKVLPGLPGIISIFEKKGNVLKNILFIGCWRDGCRQCLTRLFNPEISKQLFLYESLKDRDLFYKYTVIDSSPKDMQDILHWLINSYDNELNSPQSFKNSGRFKEVYVDERDMGNDDIIEKIYTTYH